MLCFCFFVLSFPSSNFYFLDKDGVQSGTPAPARKVLGPSYFLEEMSTGIIHICYNVYVYIGHIYVVVHQRKWKLGCAHGTTPKLFDLQENCRLFMSGGCLIGKMLKPNPGKQWCKVTVDLYTPLYNSSYHYFMSLN